MEQQLFEQILDDGFITRQQFDGITHFEKTKPLSLQWDLRILLYIGILLLISGLGIFIYENIDSIGHITIIAIVCAGWLACYGWCFMHSRGFSAAKLQSPSVLFDYVLLLGSLLMLTLIEYIQYRYHIFGYNWRLAVFIPMVVLFFSAYYFDHLGILSLAITNLAAWAGLTITPWELLKSNSFDSSNLIYTALVLGAGLVVAGMLSKVMNIKAHFAFTYKNFGNHLLLISCLWGMGFYYNMYFLWFWILMVPASTLFFLAIKERSFYFVVINLLYAYFGLSTVVVRSIVGGESGLYLTFLYFIISCIALIRALMYYNRLLQHQ